MNKNESKATFQPYIAATNTQIKEFTFRAIFLGAIFGIIYGAANAYLSLKAGMSVSASIPIAVLAITIGKKYFRTSILENNIIQTTGSAGESIATAVVFTLPGFLFLTAPHYASLFNYTTIFILALFGGILGTLMMVPLRNVLIVQEHKKLPYPEGTACASILIAGEKGGQTANKAFWGIGVASIFSILEKFFNAIPSSPIFSWGRNFKIFPGLQISGELVPEYLGVGYIIGYRSSAVLVAGGILTSFFIVPLLTAVIPPHIIAAALVKLGYLVNLSTDGGPGNWNNLTQSFSSYNDAIYFAYVKQIGAGAVAFGGCSALIRTIPTMIQAFRSSIKKVKTDIQHHHTITRTEKDIPLFFVGLGIIVLVIIVLLLPALNEVGIFHKIIVAILVIIFGAFFVMVSSRIVGIVGSSNSPISGMTIATIMGTALLFISLGWHGQVYEPLVLIIASMICISAANAGATSQDLKTGYIVGATPIYQQISLLIGAITSACVIGWIVTTLDKPTRDMLAHGIHHAIGSELYPAPQATLMATLIKGILSFNLDWHFVATGAIISWVVELCGVHSLIFAIGVYLPLSTTMPIFLGGMVKNMVDLKKASRMRKQKRINRDNNTLTADNELEIHKSIDDDFSGGSLFSTGLIAGGALTGLFVAILSITDVGEHILSAINITPFILHYISTFYFNIWGLFAFAFLCFILYKVGSKND
ncbi:MAG: OPT/YSL family transporter [Phycisphaerales bacterium]|nr:OPT/YSL family transporter [Phycisphaerales bacterium]